MTNPQALIGRFLLWLGFLGGALATVFRLEIADNKWATIPWLGYAAGLAIGIVGVVLIRRDRARNRLYLAGHEAGLEATAAALRAAMVAVERLNGQLAELSSEEVLAAIDDQCAPLLSEFADGRQAIANRLGVATYSKVMTEFASGERYLNRAWSAAADGYVDEVVVACGYATDFLRAANRDLEAAMADAQTARADFPK